VPAGDERLAELRSDERDQRDASRACARTREARQRSAAPRATGPALVPPRASAIPTSARRIAAAVGSKATTRRLVKGSTAASLVPVPYAV
jgi:hypothetical protein